MGDWKHGAARAVPRWLDQHSQRQGLCHLFSHVRRRSRNSPGLLPRPIRCNKQKLRTTLPPRHTTSPAAFPDGGASGTKQAGGALRMDLGCRGNSGRPGACLVGVVARCRGCLVPHSRPFWSSAWALPGKEQRDGHWAHFPGTSHAQGHQEGFQQEGGGVARPATHWGVLAAWRKGRTHLHTPQRSVHTVATTSLPDLDL